VFGGKLATQHQIGSQELFVHHFGFLKIKTSVPFAFAVVFMMISAKPESSPKNAQYPQT